MAILQVSQDLRAEADELHAVLRTLDDADWARPTRFKDWTPWDVVAHLHFFDRMSLLALTGSEALAEERAAVQKGLADGVGLGEQARRALHHLDAPTLLERWQETCRELAEQLGAADPKRRLPWFGPDMGVPMFTIARYMETWAHGQAICDLMKIDRTHTDRIHNIAVIGVKTFGWTFVNRGLESPGAPPYVRLVAPSGAVWEWNEPSGKEPTGQEPTLTERVEGAAVEFCQVVTQVRNIADTKLEVGGEVARRWMSIAQCFAGSPANPPPPGLRTAG